MKIKNSKHKVTIFCGSMFGSTKGYKDIAAKKGLNPNDTKTLNDIRLYQMT